MTRRFIRYLAATDSSPIGMLALGYLSGFLRIAPVRVGSMTGGMTGRWEHYAQLLATPMDGDFVNVVCCAPERWTWEQRVVMPKRRADGTVDPAGEATSARQELYTDGKHNVLLPDHYPPETHLVLAALRYEALVVPDPVSRDFWSDMARSRDLPDRVAVIPLPIGHDYEPLRAAFMPP
jgi:hypothetical protein